MPENLPIRLMKALEEPNQRIVALSPTVREAREDLDADARLLHPDFASVVQVRMAAGEIKFLNGSRVQYIGGDLHRLEQQMRGRVADYIDGIWYLPKDLQDWLKARMAS